MTTEEKAKAYDEALEKAKSMIDDLRKGEDILAVSDLESMFPELKESEDEKIRKGMIRFLNSEKAEGIFTYEARQSWIAYLEKQKINTEGDFGRGYDCGYKACLNSHGAEWFEKQKEQKPEWSEEDEHRYGDAIYFLETTKMFYADTSEIELTIDWLKSLRPDSYKNCNSRWSEDIIRRGIKEVGLTQYQINWLKNNVFPPKENPKGGSK